MTLFTILQSKVSKYSIETRRKAEYPYIPRMKTSYGDRGFSVHGPSVWNSLPNDLRSTDMSIETFRARLKAFLVWTLTTAHLLLSANLGYTNGIVIIHDKSLSNLL